MHVSPGLGTSKYAPFRFLCPPEATLLELRRAPGGDGPASVGRSAAVGAGPRVQRPDAASSNAASYPATMASLENRRCNAVAARVGGSISESLASRSAACAG